MGAIQLSQEHRLHEMRAVCANGFLAICFVFGHHLVFLNVLRGDERAPTERVEFIMSGVHTERERVRRGIFHITGVEVTEYPYPDGRMQGEVRYFGAFDIDKEHWRLDMDYPIRLPRRAGASVHTPHEIGRVYRSIVHTPTLRVYFDDRRHRIELHLPDTRHPDSLPSGREAFDVRTVGLLNFHQTFFRGPPLGRAGEWIVGWNPYLTACIDKGEGLFQFEWDFPVGRTRLWIDTHSGYLVMRREDYSRYPPPPGEEGEEEIELDEESHISWQNIEGMFVPAKFEIRRRRRVVVPVVQEHEMHENLEQRVAYQEYHFRYSIEWEVVNGNVPDELFDYEMIKFSADRYTIADARSGELRIIGVVQPPGSSERSARPPRRFRYLAMTVGVVALLSIACILVVHSWRQVRR